MQSILKLILTLLLGAWLGATVFFSFVAAPALFQLPRAQVITKEQAGDIAAALLKRYFICAVLVLILALILSSLLAVATARPPFTRCAVIVAIALLIHVFDGFVWAPKVHAIREQRRANPSAELDKQFGRAHGISFGLNFLMIVGTAWAFVVVARPE
jgi:hypothetical protein